MSDKNRIFVGNVCADHHGRLGVVESMNAGCSGDVCGTIYYGRTLAGEFWQSIAPIKLASSVEEFYAEGSGLLAEVKGEGK